MCYDKALALRENLPAIWNNRGIALKYMGKYDEALRSYNTALQFDPKFADAYLNKAYLYFDLKKYEEARNALVDYLRLKEDARGYLLLANVFAKRDMKKEAIEAVKKALELEPGNQEARELLDNLEGKSRELKNYEEIKKILREEIEKISVQDENIERKIKNARENLERGNIAKALKDILEAKELVYSQSIEELKDVLYQNTERLLDLANMGVENLKNLGPKELNALGLEAMKRVILCPKEEERKEEEYPRGYAHILYEEKRWNELKKFKDEIAENALGLRYFKARKYKNAEEHFKNAFFKAPNFYEAELNLAYTYLKNGEERKANALLKHLGLEEYFKK